MDAVVSAKSAACGGAGMLCLSCNTVEEGASPRLPEGFKTEIDKDG